MKKLLLLSSLLLIHAIVIAQAPKYVLFEHFTNTSCGPCAQQNPGFQADLILPNASVVRHISYHPWWPSNTDPFYLYDVPTQTDRTMFYEVSGVPDVRLNGNVKNGGPSSFSQADIDQVQAETSPISLDVSWSDIGSERKIIVKVNTVGDKPTGDFTLQTVIIEKLVTLPAPAANGEKEFPNVMRKMLPDVNGQAITLADKGSTVIQEYTYSEDASLQLDKLEVIAFVQNNDTKEVLNIGSTFDPTIITQNRPTTVVKNLAASKPTTFEYEYLNKNSQTESLTIKLNSDQPSNWKKSMAIGSQTYIDEATVSIEAGKTVKVIVNIEPGITPAVSTYTLSVYSATNPNIAPINNRMYVISGISDLVVHNSSATGDGKKHPIDWKTQYDEGFNLANGTTYGHGTESILKNAVKDKAMDGIKHIYFNAGWSFPALTSELSTTLKTFAESGGNIMVSGQDVAWATFDQGTSNTYANEEAQDLANQIMGVDYVDDGASTLTKFTPVKTDGLFGNELQSTLTAYYTSTYFFPDRLKVFGTGVATHNYNGLLNGTNCAAIRNQGPNYKTFWLAPGVEQLSLATRKELIKLIYNWFHGIISSTDFDLQASQLELGQNIPNPVSEETTISYSPIPTDHMILKIYDVNGSNTDMQILKVGQTSSKINVSNLKSGIYYYNISDSKTSGLPRKMIVIK